jgi:hypothetical protein
MLVSNGGAHLGVAHPTTTLVIINVGYDLIVSNEVPNHRLLLPVQMKKGKEFTANHTKANSTKAV